MSEFEFLTRVIKRLYPEQPTIQILKANGDIVQAERTINAIEKAFTPLNSSIYRDKQIIILDHPSEQTVDGVNDFLQRHPHLNHNNQVFKLPVRDLEQYYPDHVDPTYGNWRKTQGELDEENEHGKRLFTGKRKKQLAKFVGDNISKNQFEKDVQISFLIFSIKIRRIRPELFCCNYGKHHVNRIARSNTFKMTSCNKC